MTLRLTYFPFAGRGEQIRLMLHALGLPFEDRRIRRAEFVAMKQEGPSLLMFGSVPLLEDGEVRLCQGPVILSYLAARYGDLPDDVVLRARADAIAWGAEDLRSKYFTLLGEGAVTQQAAFLAGDWVSRWLPSFEGLLGEEDFFIGGRLTHADIAVFEALSAVMGIGGSLSGFARLEAFHARIAALPRIAAYLAG